MSFVVLIRQRWGNQCCLFLEFLSIEDVDDLKLVHLTNWGFPNSFRCTGLIRIFSSLWRMVHEFECPYKVKSRSYNHGRCKIMLAYIHRHNIMTSIVFAWCNVDWDKTMLFHGNRGHIHLGYMIWVGVWSGLYLNREAALSIYDLYGDLTIYDNPTIQLTTLDKSLQNGWSLPIFWWRRMS